MAATRTGLVFEEMFAQHLPPWWHPESPRRLAAVESGLVQSGLMDELERIEPIQAELDWVHWVHTARYIRQAQIDAESGREQLSTGDTPICPDSFIAALAAVGGVAAATEAVVAGRVHNAFCAVRPPGHHARPEGGMGFCLINSLAVAVRYAQRVLGVGRVLVIDWDVHHGNGTQEAFYTDPTVLTYSSHQEGWYPMAVTGLGWADEIGAGPGEGFNINVPLPAGVDDEALLDAMKQHLIAPAERFDPELVFIAAGFDVRKGDPLGYFNVTDDGIAELTRLSVALAPAGKVVSVLEGGYNLPGLSAATAAHVAALLPEPVPAE